MDRYLKNLKSIFLNTILDPTFIPKLSESDKRKVRVWKHRIQNKTEIQEATMRKFLEKHIHLTVEIYVKNKNIRG